MRKSEDCLWNRETSDHCIDTLDIVIEGSFSSGIGDDVRETIFDDEYLFKLTQLFFDDASEYELFPKQSIDIYFVVF